MAPRILIACLVAMTTAALPAPARADAGVSDEIVVLRDGGLTRAERAQAGVRPERDLPLDGVELVRAEGGRAEALAALRADPDVVWAEPNLPRRLAAEPLGGALWGLHNTGQSVWWRRGVAGADIDAPEAWTISRGAGVVVAVTDTGVDAGHPDLAGRLVPGYDFVEDDPDPQDGHGHGTHVAGTIAAAENGVGVIGVAPDAMVMPLRVLDDAGTGNSATVAAAFAYAGDHGVRIVNASLGSPYASLAERRAIEDHPGTLYVVAAGNGGSDGVGDDNDGTGEYPCAYDEPNVICVGATSSDDARAAFSNFGATTVDLSAPGDNIISSFLRGRPTVLGQHFGTGDGYEIMQGTSMAAPHVAGAAALAGSVQRTWLPAQLKSVLLDGADPLAGLAGTSVTGARLNAAATVRSAAGLPAGPGKPPPRLGPDLLAPGETTASQPVSPTRPADVASAISRLRVNGRPRVCGRHKGCQARTATISFVLAAESDITARLEQRRACERKRCGWRRAHVVTRRAAAGRTRWTIGRRLLGVRLARGAWRLSLTTSAGSAQRSFTIR